VPVLPALVRWSDNPHRPFCSERCRLSDLGAWVTEQYRISGPPLDREAAPDEAPEDDAE
jgi:endogenous inhibitor of DNA gyrase (YacG/DUF329 family)